MCPAQLDGEQIRNCGSLAVGRRASHSEIRYNYLPPIPRPMPPALRAPALREIEAHVEGRSNVFHGESGGLPKPVHRISEACSFSCCVH
jgi:hypothetical protein